MFNIKYINFKRLNEYIDLYFSKDITLVKRFGIIIDFIGSVIVDGAGMNDYFEYQFYKKRHNERAKFVVRARRKKIANKYNQKEYLKYFSNKALFNETFAEFVKRDWIDMENVTRTEFMQFLEKHQTFLIKPKTESCGIGIRVINMKQHSPDELYKKYSGNKVIAEEKISQYGEIKTLHPESINTLRIVTVRTEDNNVHVMNANLRVGIDSRIMDNFHQEGIAASIDINKGIVSSKGCDMHLKQHIIHPSTGEKLLGFTVPQWEDAVNMVKKAARKIPEVSYIGWDVAVQCNNYEIVLIEGNPDSDTDVQQMCDQVGKWPDYVKIMNI